MPQLFCEKDFEHPNTSENSFNNTYGAINTNDLYEAAICYLDKKNYFMKIKKECDIYWNDNSNASEGVGQPGCLCAMQENNLKYVNSNARVFRFGVNVFVQDLMEENAPLCDIVLHQPMKAREIFKRVVYIALKSLEIMPETFTCNQLLVNIKIDWLPPFSEQSARYQCPLEDCEGYQGNKFVRVHIPGAWETETIRKDFLCLYCKSPLVEDPTWRILGDKVIAQVIPSDPLCTSAHSVRHQSITVYCRDELIKNILLGRKYSVIGILVTRKIESSIFILMEANSMKLIENVPHNVQSSIHNLPPPVVELYHDRLCSPWSFGLNLAYVFADKVSPPGTFYQFKLGLLLSIINSTNSTILARSKSVLAVGSDTLTLQRLFLYAGTFGHHCIHHTSLNFLMGQVYKDLLHSSVLWFVEAGTLLLATDGVCFLGDLSFTSKNNQEILGRALDSGNIIITPPPQVNCVSDLPLLKYPLQCTVWGLISSNSRKKGDSGRKQMEQTSAGLENLDKILIDGFGMIYITDSTVPSGDDYYNQLTICQISVKSSALSSSNISMSNEEWKKFLTYASSLDTRFTEEAEFLIQGYYIASRRVHASVAHGPEFPMAAVSTLMSVAHAFSKLSLRQRVTDSDAVMAILLYEETLSARYGYSTLNVRNMPHARNKDISYLFGVENDQRLHQFHKLLQQFIATYAGDVGLKEE